MLINYAFRNFQGILFEVQCQGRNAILWACAFVCRFGIKIEGKSVLHRNVSNKSHKCQIEIREFELDTSESGEAFVDRKPSYVNFHFLLMSSVEAFRF